jgi:hypothetical protein
MSETNTPHIETTFRTDDNQDDKAVLVKDENGNVVMRIEPPPGIFDEDNDGNGNDNERVGSSSSSRACLQGREEDPTQAVLEMAIATRREALQPKYRGLDHMERKLRIRRVFRDFALGNPVLFDKCCDPSFPLHMLTVMLDKLKSVKNEEMTPDQATDSTIDELNTKYVNPVVDRLEEQRRGTS